MCREVMEKVGGMGIATSSTMATGISSSISMCLKIAKILF